MSDLAQRGVRPPPGSPLYDAVTDGGLPVVVGGRGYYPVPDPSLGEGRVSFRIATVTEDGYWRLADGSKVTELPQVSR